MLNATNFSEAKRTLLQKYLRGNLPSKPGGPGIITRPFPGNRARVSLGQEQLWAHSQLVADRPAYNEPVTVGRTGTLNVDALRRSLNEIIRRHEAWRTTFEIVNFEPVQVIHPARDFDLPVVDLRKLPSVSREAEALRLATQDIRQPFDLSRGPLLRARLVQVGDADYRLYLALHQIVMDGVSMYSIFLPELSALYEAFSRDQPSPLAELPLQYADFAHWQRERLSGEVLSTQMAFWKRQLADASFVLDLPTDRPRPAIEAFRGAQQTFALSKSLTDALKALSQQARVTLFMTLLAAFKTLLYRYTGQEDLVVGTVTTTRKRSEFERLLGFFLNTLLLRTNLSGDPTFWELLGRVRQVTVEALSHDDVPVHFLVKELRPARDRSRNPLFQVMFVLEPPLPTPRTGWTLAQMDVDPGISRVDLYVELDDRPSGIIGRFRYNTDLFDGASIRRMRTHFESLLESIVASPDQRLSTLSLSTATKQNRSSVHASSVRPTNTFVEFSKEDIEQTIATRFQKQVKQYPNHLAISTQHHQWTYAKLNLAADQIAHTLLRSCDSDEGRIGLLFNQGAAMIAAILGVLKARKAYVPLDPTYPIERLAYIVEDSKIETVLTDSRNLAFAKSLCPGAMKFVNTDAMDATVATSNPNLPVFPDTLAYILYTSGSTGWPKGVMQSHRNVLHHIRNYTNNLHINACDRLTLLSSYCFDAAIMDIFGALLNGAALFPMDLKQEELSVLVGRMIEEKITIYHSTPTVYRSFVSVLNGKRELSTIRLVVLGGEEVQRKDVDLFKQNFSSDAIFVNGLGPTESTLALQYFIDTTTKISGNGVPVGYPVKDTEILLLNEAGQRTEVYGEIGIRSAHLALGYWQKPQMTKAAFLPDPEGETRRIYRTGDMGRLLPDGSIAFLGRKDFQVKIRGYRVELGEIEAVLAQHPAVRENVVVAREDEPGHARLIAYVVSNQAHKPTVTDLYAFLKQKLPDYMVPSTFVFLDALPLTPNGKVNRRALPRPDQGRPELEKVFVAPQNLLELQLTKIWEKILGIQPIGVRDNFFELGGHSLLALQLIAQLEKILGKNLPPATLFQAPTIAQLASILRQGKWPDSWSSLIPIQPGGSKLPFFWIHGDSSNAFLPGYLGPDQPLYGLEHQSQDGKPALYTRVETIAAHYLNEIHIVRPQGPYFLGGYSFGSIVAFEAAQQLKRQGEDVSLLILLDPPSLTNGKSSSSLIPGFFNGLMSVTRFRDELRRHLHNLALLGPHEKLVYVLVRVKSTIKGKINERTTRISKILKKVLYKISLAMGRPIPPSLRSRYILDVYRQAGLKYVPQPYPGRVILFKGETRSSDHQLNWGRLLAGGLEVYEVPGDHLDMTKEPYVQFWAESLKACLHRAQ